MGMREGGTTLIVVAALVVAVLPLGGCNADAWRGALAGWNQTIQDHDARQRAFVQSRRESRARELAEERIRLLRQQNAIMQEHADHPFGRRW